MATSLALLAALLNGCASAPQVPTSGPLDRSKGVVVGSITYETLSSYAVWLRRVPDGERQTVQAGPSPLSPIPVATSDFDWVRGETFALALEPGEYEIYSWLITGGPVRVAPASPFSVRFTVTRGQAAYLGRFHFRSIERRGLAVTGTHVTLYDAQEEDVPVAVKKFAALKNTDIARPVQPGFRIADIGTGSRVQVSLPPVMVIPAVRR